MEVEIHTGQGEEIRN